MMLTYAEQYIKQGFSLIPVEGKKTPPNFSWEKYQAERASLEDVRNWQQQLPSMTGLAVVAGPISGRLILDVDVHKGGMESLKGKELPITQTARSASGGFHYHYRYDSALDPIATTKQLIHSGLPGLDVRGKGGICVLPPSRGLQGTPYVWISGREPWSVPLAPVPSWLLNVLKGVSNVKSTTQTGRYSGPRHPEFIRVASGYFGRGLPSDEVRSLMVEWNEETNANPFDEERFEKEWQGILKYWASGKYMNQETRDFYDAQAEAETAADTISSDDMVKLAQDKIQWVVQGVIPKQAMVLLGGQPKVGKSWLLLDLAIEVARAGKWLGMFPASQGGVLYIDQENAQQLLTYRYKKILSAKGNPAGLPIHFKVTKGLKVDRPGGYNVISSLLEKHKPSLVICDALIRFHSGDENSASSLRDVHDGIAKLVHKFGCTFLFADHEKKSWVNKDGRVTEGPGHLRGSSEKEAFADMVFSLTKGDFNQLRMYHTYSRWGTSVDSFGVEIKDTSMGQTIVRGIA